MKYSTIYSYQTILGWSGNDSEANT